MKKSTFKKILVTIISLSIVSCAELQALAKSFNSDTRMPSYEFYETFTTTNDAYLLDTMLLKSNPTHIIQDPVFGKHYEFRISKSLLNNIYPNYDPIIDDADSASSIITSLNNKNKSIAFNFSAGSVFMNKDNFYKIFNLSEHDVKISQLKFSCLSEKGVYVPFFEVVLRNNKKLYLIIDYGGGATSPTSLTFYKAKPSCKALDYDKSIKEYGNPNFNS